MKIKIYLVNAHPKARIPVMSALYQFNGKIEYVNRNEKFDIMIDNGLQLTEVAACKNF